MAKGISVYPTVNTGAEKPMDITGTEVGDKRALDVSVKGGTVTGELTPSGLRNGGRVTVKTINDTTWTPILDAGELLSITNQINIQNFSGVEIKVNHDYIDALPAGYVGMRILDQSERFYQVNGAFQMPLLKASPGSGSIDIEVEQIG